MILKTIENDKAKTFTEKFETMLESIDLSKLDSEDLASYPDDIKTMKMNSVEYAKMRADWEFMSREEQVQNDSFRSILHDRFMISVKILIRLANKYSEGKWSDLLEEAEAMHRKEFGDIACYITYLISVSNK